MARGHRPHPARLRHRHPDDLLRGISGSLSSRRLHLHARRLLGSRWRQRSLDESGHELDLHPHLSGRALHSRGRDRRPVARAPILASRIVRQLCRELLLLESSDWQFLVTTGAARDYAEARFTAHNDQFNEVKAFWQTFEASGESDRGPGDTPGRDRASRRRLPRYRSRSVGRRSEAGEASSFDSRLPQGPVPV